jgi:SAM-dependent methyltransferase
MSPYRLLKTLYGGRISFNDPWLGPAFRVIDVADAIVRRYKGGSDLPPFSIRLRTNGIPGEFGGTKFTRSARRLIERLPHEVRLSDARVLDLGCSCGRLAYALRPVLGQGCYSGLDIDRVTIDWARTHLEAADPRLQFVHADVHSDVYHPATGNSAAEYVFPFPDRTFDTIIAYSLFTHLLADELQNYLRQAARCLHRQGRFVFSCFVRDERDARSFLAGAMKSGDTWLYSRTSPRKATAFDAEFLQRSLREAGFGDWLLLEGDWRDANRQSGADQDLFVCRL